MPNIESHCTPTITQDYINALGHPANGSQSFACISNLQGDTFYYIVDIGSGFFDIVSYNLATQIETLVKSGLFIGGHHTPLSVYYDSAANYLYMLALDNNADTSVTWVFHTMPYDITGDSLATNDYDTGYSTSYSPFGLRPQWDISGGYVYIAVGFIGSDQLLYKFNILTGAVVHSLVDSAFGPIFYIGDLILDLGNDTLISVGYSNNLIKKYIASTLTPGSTYTTFVSSGQLDGYGINSEQKMLISFNGISAFQAINTLTLTDAGSMVPHPLLINNNNSSLGIDETHKYIIGMGQRWDSADYILFLYYYDSPNHHVAFLPMPTGYTPASAVLVNPSSNYFALILGTAYVYPFSVSKFTVT